ncbi:10198_t:CDS:2, partial [Racocetra fulgida]
MRNEPLAFPHSLWFGALDITQDLIAKTQRDSTLGICYYLALESLQKAPLSFIRFKAIEKEKAITTFPHTITPSDDSISDIVSTELSCPVTYQIPNNFQILPCEHLISPEALQQIINKTSQPTCPLCRKIIDLNSVINLPQSTICQGIRNHLPEDNNNNVAQDHNKNTSDESSDEEEINISKLKSQQKFKISDSTLETTINALTEILEEYPTSYSLKCYRAK